MLSGKEETVVCPTAGCVRDLRKRAKWTLGACRFVLHGEILKNRQRFCDLGLCYGEAVVECVKLCEKPERLEGCSSSSSCSMPGLGPGSSSDNFGPNTIDATVGVEGFNSILSNLSSRMPRLGLAAASAKMSLRKGRSIEPQQCVELHKEVAVFMNSEENANRFNTTVIAFDATDGNPEIMPEVVEPTDPRPCRRRHLVEMIEYKGDATNSEAIDKAKVHVATILCAWYEVPDITQRWTEITECGRPNKIAEVVFGTHSICDLQKVLTGDGEELTRIVRKEFASVGAPHWDNRMNNAKSSLSRLTLYALSLDHGPDNVFLARRLKKSFEGYQNIMICVQWCLFHQYHLGVRSLLEVFESWTWDCDQKLPCKYHGGVATIANTWRSTGIHTRLQELVGLQGEAAAATVNKLPGKALTGRWGAIDDVERTLLKGQAYLPSAFESMFNESKKKQKKVTEKPQQVGGVDETAEHREVMRKWRNHAVGCLSHHLFWVMVRVSWVCKGPMRNFFIWGQKRLKETNARVSSADKAGKAYLGPTMLSDMVSFKIAQVRQVVENT